MRLTPSCEVTDRDPNVPIIPARGGGILPLRPFGAEVVLAAPFWKSGGMA